jgi:long-chain acyl-CoA synthetase
MSATKPLRYPGAFAAEHGDKPAVIIAETGNRMTYAELHAYAAKTAHVFRELGLEPGDHLAICLENRVEYPALHWGAHYAGLYYTFVPTHLTAPEVAYIVDDCEAKAFVFSGAVPDAITDAVKDLDAEPLLLDLDESGRGRSLPDLLVDQPADVLAGGLEGSEMNYSSGTTGRPKGIKPALSGDPLGTNSMVGDLAVGYFGASSDSVYLSPAPYYHTAPGRWVHGMTSIGATVVMLQKFSPAGALDAIERHRVTHSQWVPTMFKRMLSLPSRDQDVSSLQVAIHAAAPCPPDVKRAMIDWWGPIIVEYYAGTEAAGICMVRSEEWLERPGTVGRAIVGTVHVVDEAGTELPPGEDGLICFSGGRPFEYHNDEAKTREAYVRPGTSTMGDIGHVDADGFLYLTDRQSNMIISGGVNIYPQETEDVLISHPDVLDAAVIGVPNPDFGEEVLAVVQLQPGVHGDNAVAIQLDSYCRTRLSAVKCPRTIEFRESLPREENGKLLKRKIRDEYWVGRESRLT